MSTLTPGVSDYDRFIALGCTGHDAQVLVSAGVDPDVVGGGASDAVAFVEAALHQSLDDINERLAIHGGDAEAAWEEWAAEESDGDGEDS